MLVSGIELVYWFLKWKKIIESVRDFGIVCGRDTFYRDFRYSGVIGIEIGCLVEIPMRFVISLVLWSRVRDR
jgi:hypothetical protein